MSRISIVLALCSLASLPASAQFSHFTGYVGGGFTPPLNPIGSRLNNGWNITAGAGVNTSHNFGLMLDFLYTDMGINDTFLRQAQAPNGNVRVWGFSLNPVVHLAQEGRPVDFYVTGGGGIYNRTVEYTQPTFVTTAVFDPWFGFFPASIPTNQVLSSFTQYKGGLNGGVGFSVKLGQSKVKAFAEARYHHIFTHNVGTDIIPVSFGLRW